MHLAKVHPIDNEGACLAYGHYTGQQEAIQESNLLDLGRAAKGDRTVSKYAEKTKMPYHIDSKCNVLDNEEQIVLEIVLTTNTIKENGFLLTTRKTTTSKLRM